MTNKQQEKKKARYLDVLFGGFQLFHEKGQAVLGNAVVHSQALSAKEN
jgi:hypothetical protein